MASENYPKDITVSFTGYRPQKISNSLFGGAVTEDEIKLEVSRIIRRLYTEGYRIFLSGMAEGFDLMAADAVISLKKELPGLEFVAVFPYSRRKESASLSHYVSNADRIVSVSDNYHSQCFLRRNDYLVDNCSLVVCYYDGKYGGTRYTVQRAKQKGLPIINVLNY